MSRRLLDIPLLLIIVCIASLFIGWYSLPTWLPQALNSQLERYNIQTSHWDFERPGLSEWRIHQIDITQNQTTIAELSNINIQFSLPDLLKKKIKNIHVDQLNWVSLPRKADEGRSDHAKPETTSVTIPLIVSSLFSIKKQLPITSVKIDNILIDNPVTSLMGKDATHLWETVKQASLSMVTEKKTTSMEFNISTDEYSAFLKAQLNTKLSTSLQIQNRMNDRSADIELLIDTKGENLNLLGKHSVDLVLIKHLLKTYAFDATTQINKTLANINLNGEWTGKWDISFNEHLQLTNLNLLSEQQFNTNVSGKSGSVNIEQAIKLNLINQSLLLQLTPSHYSFFLSNSAANKISQELKLPPDLSIPDQWLLTISGPIELSSTLDDTNRWYAKPVTFSLNGKSTNSFFKTIGQLNVGVNKPILLDELALTMGTIKLSEWHFNWDTLNASGTSRYDLQTKKGTSSWEIDLPNAYQWLARYGNYTPKDLAFNNGNLAARGDFNWQLSPRLRFNTSLFIEASDWNGLWNKQPFTGASFKSDITLSEKMDVKGKNSLAVINSFNPGLPIDTIQSRFTWHLLDGDPESLKINVESLSANLLSGSVFSASAFTVRPLNIETNIDFQLKNLSLADMLALEQQPITGEGTIDGLIPVKVSGKDISVNNGQVHAKEPGGLIKLDQAASFRQMAGSNQGLSLLFEALDNFHYQTLESNVDYQPNGDLLLAASLSGSNPDFKGGQVFNFNINIEENLKALFKSLQLSEDINERISEKYK